MMCSTSSFIVAVGVALQVDLAFAQSPPPLEDFVALASRDEKVSEAAAERLAPVWKNTYASMVIDLARFFRPVRETGPMSVADDSLGGDEDPQTGRTPGGARETFSVGKQTPESLIRGRLIRFLSKRTGKTFGTDLKLWRKWSWTLPDDPHPSYAAFKARLYANVDARMAGARPPRQPVQSRPRLRKRRWRSTRRETGGEVAQNGRGSRTPGRAGPPWLAVLQGTWSLPGFSPGSHLATTGR